MYDDLITKARELCDAATPGPWSVEQYFPATTSDEPVPRFVRIEGRQSDIFSTLDFEIKNSDAAFIAASRTLVPQLCDVLAAAEKEIAAREEQIAKLANLVMRYETEIVPPFKKLVDEKDSKIAELTARAEKAEAELSELRSPKPAIALKMDSMVQVGHVRFGPGCTIWKCPCCGTFLTPTHKYCLECGQAMSYPKTDLQHGD